VGLDEMIQWGGEQKERRGKLTGPAHQEDKGILVNSCHHIPGNPNPTDHPYIYDGSFPSPCLPQYSRLRPRESQGLVKNPRRRELESSFC